MASIADPPVCTSSPVVPPDAPSDAPIEAVAAAAPAREAPAAAAVPALGATAKRFATADLVQLAGAAAGTAAIVYVIGGIVMWLRFRKAGLPPDQAVALMDRQTLLVIGMRLMILPAVVTGTFAWLVTRRRRTSVTPGRPRRVTTKVLLAELGVGVALMLPFSFASATWILGALGIVGWVCFERRADGARMRWRRRTAAPRRLVTIALVVLVAAFVSLGRQFDQPVQLPSATVDLAGKAPTVEGTYISASATEVFLGVDRQITAIPRSRILRVSLGPPKDRGPTASIMSRLLGGGRYAITPFEWWCDGERYSWGELGRLCRTQPLVRNPWMRLDGPGVPVEIRCPPQARHACRGWMTLETVKRYMPGNRALPRRLRFKEPLVSALALPGQAAQIDPGRTAQVCVPIDEGPRWLLRRPAVGEPPVPPPMPARIPQDKDRPGILRGAPAPDGPSTSVDVPFRLIVSNDEDGKDVLRETAFTVTLPGPDLPMEHWGECSAAARAARLSRRSRRGRGSARATRETTSDSRPSARSTPPR